MAERDIYAKIVGRRLYFFCSSYFAMPTNSICANCSYFSNHVSLAFKVAKQAFRLNRLVGLDI